MKNICTINNTEDKRVIIMFDEEENKLITSDGEVLDTPEVKNFKDAVEICYAMYFNDGAGVWDAEWCEDDDDDEDEAVLNISKIDIKTETFCTRWNDKLYCVDICEDAEEFSAWLYNPDYSVKSLTVGVDVNDISRDEFINMVFSNLPYYIKDYAEEYED